MKRFVLWSLAAGVPFGLVMGLFFFLVTETAGAALLAGALAGTLFGAGLGGAVVILRKGLAHGLPSFSDADEEVLFQTHANHFRGMEAVGGWLVLTDRRLLFRPHRMNIQKREWSLPRADLIRLEPYRVLGVLPTGLRALTASGEERFVVEERRRWIERDV